MGQLVVGLVVGLLLGAVIGWIGGRMTGIGEGRYRERCYRDDLDAAAGLAGGYLVHPAVARRLTDPALQVDSMAEFQAADQPRGAVASRPRRALGPGRSA